MTVAFLTIVCLGCSRLLHEWLARFLLLVPVLRQLRLWLSSAHASTCMPNKQACSLEQQLTDVHFVHMKAAYWHMFQEGAE